MITKNQAYTDQLLNCYYFRKQILLRFIHKYDYKEKHKYDYKENTNMKIKFLKKIKTKIQLPFERANKNLIHTIKVVPPSKHQREKIKEPYYSINILLYYISIC